MHQQVSRDERLEKSRGVDGSGHMWTAPDVWLYRYV
jgi:hypothetical protein